MQLQCFVDTHRNTQHVWANMLMHPFSGWSNPVNQSHTHSSPEGNLLCNIQYMRLMLIQVSLVIISHLHCMVSQHSALTVLTLKGLLSTWSTLRPNPPKKYVSNKTTIPIVLTIYLEIVRSNKRRKNDGSWAAERDQSGLITWIISTVRTKPSNYLHLIK
jgi:hypothetical protein